MGNVARITEKLLAAFFCTATLLALAPATALAAQGDECTASGCNGAYDANGFCDACDGYEEPSLKDGYYQIANAGQLYWFSAKADADRNVNAVLTEDINLEQQRGSCPRKKSWGYRRLPGKRHGEKHVLVRVGFP